MKTIKIGQCEEVDKRRITEIVMQFSSEIETAFEQFEDARVIFADNWIKSPVARIIMEICKAQKIHISYSKELSDYSYKKEFNIATGHKETPFSKQGRGYRYVDIDISPRY